MKQWHLQFAASQFRHDLRQFLSLQFPDTSSAVLRVLPAVRWAQHCCHVHQSAAFRCPQMEHIAAEHHHVTLPTSLQAFPLSLPDFVALTRFKPPSTPSPLMINLLYRLTRNIQPTSKKTQMTTLSCWLGSTQQHNRRSSKKNINTNCCIRTAYLLMMGCR